jgi:hypothetical protein
MKQITFIAFLAILLHSCTTTIPPYSGSIFFDYSPLTSVGIFVTESNSVNFDYTSLGSIVVMARGGGKVTYYGPSSSSVGNFNPMDFSEVAEYLKYELLKKSANGIINLKVIYLPGDNTQGAGYTITGMAIRSNKFPISQQGFSSPRPNFTIQDSDKAENKENDRSKYSVRDRR